MKRDHYFWGLNFDIASCLHEITPLIFCVVAFFILVFLDFVNNWGRFLLNLLLIIFTVQFNHFLIPYASLFYLITALQPVWLISFFSINPLMVGSYFELCSYTPWYDHAFILLFHIIIFSYVRILTMVFEIWN